ncbi:MAG: type II toxin-antitoxin system PemK/MazF family toxin [Candidatus Eremiobacterota bacterium]
MSPHYIPERGDLCWLDFDPQIGREQAGRRPALVLSRGIYNERSALAWVCPITSRRKGYPFELVLPEGLPVEGVVLVDQVRSLDYRGRKASRIARVPAAWCAAALDLARTLLD